MNINEKLNQFLTEHEELRKKGKLLFADTVSALFDEYSELEGIAWEQFTPYFNDGDPCEFGIRSDVYFIKTGIKEHGLPRRAYDVEDHDLYEAFECCPPGDYGRKKALEGNEYWNRRVESYDSANTSMLEDFNALITFMNKNEDILEQLYGDHVSVCISRNENGKIFTEINECEHD